ncbi:MAG: hypothetical protein J07HB67_02716 [halophilic archaeon J07HB67]|nr:MAG: hypothetical protein J07HB67_02716 [halophilic archaeon J07HB67]
MCRRLLAVIVVVAVAGCTTAAGPTGPPGPPASPTPTATPTTGIVVESWDVTNGTDGQLVVPVTLVNQGAADGSRTVVLEAQIDGETETVRQEVTVAAGESRTVEIELDTTFEAFLDDGSLNLELAGGE